MILAEPISDIKLLLAGPRPPLILRAYADCPADHPMSVCV